MLFLSIYVDGIQVDCSFLFSLSPTEKDDSRDLFWHSPAYWDQQNWLAMKVQGTHVQVQWSKQPTDASSSLLTNSVISMMPTSLRTDVQACCYDQDAITAGSETLSLARGMVQGLSTLCDLLCYKYIRYKICSHLCMTSKVCLAICCEVGWG